VAVVGQGNNRLRLPCFSYCRRSERLALPAFGALTGGEAMPAGEQHWLIADGAVVSLNPPPPEPAPHHRG
jgi:uncharacterized protein